jgi:hypothetical protein
MPKVPIDYSKGFIYKLCCLDVNVKEIYIGSSTNFKQRKKNHKSGCNNEKNKSYNSYKYKFIRDNGGWSNWTMIELYKYPCNDKRELECEENRVMIELQSQLNSNKAYLTEEERLEYQKHYDLDHKEKITEYQNQYYLDHKEKLVEYQKQYDIDHKEIKKMKMREKIVCGNCGVMVSRGSIASHKKRKICLNFNN